MTGAKAAILDGIRNALAHSPELAYEKIERAYRQTSLLNLDALKDLFEHRLRDYGSNVHRCRNSQIRETTAAVLTSAQKQSLLIPAGFPREWLPSGFTFQPDSGLSYASLDQSNGVLTTCAVAIAETGTIVLRHSEAEGRRALTLIPDYHLCIVRSDQIVATVAEGVRLMALFATEPITTVSGPSATSDIEMTRVKGVHGPRTLEVIIVDP